MPRIIQFQNKYYYHVYNRGVDKRKVFLDKWDYVRFLESMREFNRVEPIYSLYHLKRNQLSAPSAPAGALGALDPPLIDIIAYCLNPNHYHLLVRQKKEGGISRFMQKLGAGYTCYFNEKHKRSGSLFQGKYKAKEIKSTYGLIKLSIYINCNAEIHGIAKKENWIWSSYLDYVNLRNGTLCNKKNIYKELSSPTAPAGEVGLLGSQYIKFCNELIPEIKAVKNLERYGLE